MSKIIVGAATLALLFIGAGLVHHYHKHRHHHSGAEGSPAELESYCNYYTYSGCTGCAEHSNCGWCSTGGDYLGGKCSYGASGGPNSYKCYGSWYYGAYAQCPNSNDNCGQYGRCRTCVNAPSGSCGWCMSSQMCEAGTSSGPNNGYCSGKWDWTTNDCPDCHHQYDCSSCTSHDGCGWCAGVSYNGQNGVCLYGSGYGPENGQNCPAGWTTNMGAYGNPTCAALDCSQYTTCRGCTNAPSGTCGFCTGSKVCQAGTSSGPNRGYCNGNWEWYSSNCQNDEVTAGANKKEEVEVKAQK